MTLAEAKNELREIDNKLEFYLTKKEIEFEKTQPGSVSFTNELVKGGILKDRFTHYLVKNEKYDETIIALMKDKTATEIFLTKEVERLLEYDEPSLIVYLKDEANFKWKEILDILKANNIYYSLRHVQRLYNKTINK